MDMTIENGHRIFTRWRLCIAFYGQVLLILLITLLGLTCDLFPHARSIHAFVAAAQWIYESSYGRASVETMNLAV
jgi:hypothetical protein